jgi:hypothetical protein
LGGSLVAQINALCGLSPSARAFARYLNSEGRYEGFDVAPVLIKWCQQQLEPRLPHFETDQPQTAESDPARHQTHRDI